MRASAFLCALIVMLPSGDAVHGREPPPVILPADELINRLSETYQRINSLPGLEVEYRIDRKILVPDGWDIFAWDWMELTNGFRPSDRNKLFLRKKYPSGEKGARATREKIETYDGTIKVHMETVANRTSANLSGPVWHPQVFTPQFFLYFRRLGYPIGPNPEEGEATHEIYPESYWLPDGLLKRRAAYRLRPRQENVDGDWCHVLEIPGLDEIWVQIDPVARVRRRRLHWKQGGDIREDVYFQHFEEVAPKLWLPYFIMFDRYTGPIDKPKNAGKIGERQQLKVTKITIGEIPEERFRAQIPRGAAVFDYVNNPKGEYFINRPEVDPFERALAQLKQPNSGLSWKVIASVSFLAVLGITTLVGIWWQRRAAKIRLAASLRPPSERRLSG